MLDPDKDFNDLNLADSREALDAAMKYLKYHNPKNANREYALKLLKNMQRVAKPAADNSKLTFEEFVERANQSQQD